MFSVSGLWWMEQGLVLAHKHTDKINRSWKHQFPGSISGVSPIRIIFTVKLCVLWQQQHSITAQCCWWCTAYTGYQLNYVQLHTAVSWVSSPQLQLSRLHDGEYEALVRPELRDSFACPHYNRLCWNCWNVDNTVATCRASSVSKRTIDCHRCLDQLFWTQIRVL